MERLAFEALPSPLRFRFSPDSPGVTSPVIISIVGLPELLETIGVDDSDVSVGEPADNRWCILQRTDGTWAVFYRERGGNFDESVFAAESDACYTLLGRMTLLQITRGRFHFDDEVE